MDVHIYQSSIVQRILPFQRNNVLDNLIQDNVTETIVLLYCITKSNTLHAEFVVAFHLHTLYFHRFAIWVNMVKFAAYISLY